MNTNRIGYTHKTDGLTLSDCCNETVSRAAYGDDWSCDCCHRIVLIIKEGN